MYTSRDTAIRGVLIPALILGVPGGWLALGIALGVNANVLGLTIVAALVGLVVWRIYVWRHPDGWPLPKKVLNALDAIGFKGYSDPSMQMGRIHNDKDGFSIGYSDQMRIDASMNENTREVSFSYRRRDGSWLRREDAFEVKLSKDGSDEPLVVHGAPTELGFCAKTPSEKQFAAWVGRGLCEQIVKLPLSRIHVAKETGNSDPRLDLSLIVPDGTFCEVRNVIAGAKELFWKLVGAVQAEQTDKWLK